MGCDDRGMPLISIMRTRREVRDVLSGDQSLLGGRPAGVTLTCLVTQAETPPDSPLDSDWTEAEV